MSNVMDPDLYPLLANSAEEDLVLLADIITDKGEGRISLGADVCKKLVQASSSGHFDDEARALISEEIQRFGGNSIVNLFRGGSGVAYKEVVRDVALHLKANVTSQASCETMEVAIAQKMMDDSVAKMSPEKHAEVLAGLEGALGGHAPLSAIALLSGAATSGVGKYLLTATVANSSARVLLGRGLTFASAGITSRSVGALVGPVGWVITAMWTAFDLASPAYRVTVPSVLHFAYLRQKAAILVCPACGEPNNRTANFCASCGKALQS